MCLNWFKTKLVNYLYMKSTSHELCDTLCVKLLKVNFNKIK